MSPIEAPPHHTTSFSRLRYPRLWMPHAPSAQNGLPCEKSQEVKQASGNLRSMQLLYRLCRIGESATTENVRATSMRMCIKSNRYRWCSGCSVTHLLVIAPKYPRQPCTFQGESPLLRDSMDSGSSSPTIRRHSSREIDASKKFRIQQYHHQL